jgi:hypothetical protein
MVVTQSIGEFSLIASWREGSRRASVGDLTSCAYSVDSFPQPDLLFSFIMSHKVI